MTSTATLLSGVSSNGAGSATDTGGVQDRMTLQVYTSGTVTAFSVQLQGSLDGTQWQNIGSAVLAPTAGTNVSTGVLMQQFRAVLAGYAGTGTITCVLAYSLSSGASGGGGPPTGAAGGDLGSTYPNPTVTGTHLSAALPLAQGGTGQATAQLAMDALAGATTSASYLRGSGTHVVMSAVQAGDLPAATTSTQGAVVLDGTAGDIAALGAQAAGAVGKAADAGHVHPTTGVVLSSSLPLAIGSGGTGQTTAAAALSALSGAAVAGDIGGTSASPQVTGTHLSSALPVAQGGTGQTSASAAFNALSPNTTLGDVTYGSGTNTSTRLPGSTSATKQYLQQTGNGSVSAAPAWGTIAAGDVPTLNQNTTGSAGSLSATLAVASGGTGAATLTGLVTGNGTSAMTAVAAPAGTVVGTSDTQTLTNKRVTKRVLALSAGSATPAINTDSYDVVHITAQTAAITSFTTNLTGTPVDGDTLRISVTDDGTARALTWGTSFEASTIALPTTTVISARLDVGFFWNTATSRWRCVGVS